MCYIHLADQDAVILAPMSSERATDQQAEGSRKRSASPLPEKQPFKMLKTSDEGVQTETDALKVKVKALKDKLAKVQAAYDEAYEERVEMLHEIGEYKAKEADWSASKKGDQERTKTKNIESIKTTEANAQKKWLKKLDKQRADSDQKYADLEAKQKKALEEKHGKYQTAITEMKNKYEERLKKAKQAESEAKGECVDMKAEHAQWKKDLAEEKKRLKEEQQHEIKKFKPETNETVKKLKADIKPLNDKIAQMQSTIDEQTKQVSQLETDVESAREGERTSKLEMEHAGLVITKLKDSLQAEEKIGEELDQKLEYQGKQVRLQRYNCNEHMRRLTIQQRTNFEWRNRADRMDRIIAQLKLELELRESSGRGYE